MSLILGIDEAGRGPVIGPMVIAGALIDSTKLNALKELKLRDSKKLPRAVRTELYDEIRSLCDGVLSLHYSPQDLELNLTDVEMGAITEITKHFQPSELFVDAPVPPAAIPLFTRVVHAKIGISNLEITAENGADDRYEIVSAASIIAKVERDREIEKLREVHGDFGWGYPAEPKTQNFLRDCYVRDGTFPDCVRQRWATIQRLISEVHQQRLGL